MAQATTILDASDKPAFTIFKEQRLEVPIEQMSPNLIKAVVSVEDQRFYEHSGVDAIRVAAAVVRNFEEGRRARRRQHHHAAARAAELPQPRQDIPPEAARRSFSPRTSRRCTARTKSSSST